MRSSGREITATAARWRRGRASGTRTTRATGSARLPRYSMLARCATPLCPGNADLDSVLVDELHWASSILVASSRLNTSASPPAQEIALFALPQREQARFVAGPWSGGHGEDAPAKPRPGRRSEQRRRRDQQPCWCANSDFGMVKVETIPEGVHIIIHATDDQVDLGLLGSDVKTRDAVIVYPRGKKGEQKAIEVPLVKTANGYEVMDRPLRRPRQAERRGDEARHRRLRSRRDLGPGVGGDARPGRGEHGEELREGRGREPADDRHGVEEHEGGPHERSARLADEEQRLVLELRSRGQRQRGHLRGGEAG